MHSTPESVGTEAASPDGAGPARPWDACVWPLAVFMAVGALEPTVDGGGLAGALGIPFAAYPLVSAAKLPEEIDAVARPERSVKVFSLSSTWLCFATVVGLSRAIVRIHHPSDVVGGMVTGLLLAQVALLSGAADLLRH